MPLATKDVAPAIKKADAALPTAAKLKPAQTLNDVVTSFNALLAKLDADAGVTDTNYTSLLGVGDAGLALKPMSLFTSADVAAFRADRLFAAASAYAPDITLSDAYLLQQIKAAEAETSRLLRVLLEPTIIVSHTPTDAEIAGFGSSPWLEEPGYDYDGEFLQGPGFGYLVTRQRPIISVQLLQLVYPLPMAGAYPIPAEWIRLDKRAGTVRLVPANSIAAPIGAYAMSAIGGGRTIPQMVQLNYTAGLTNVPTAWPDLYDVILKKAALKVVEGVFLPQSGSISADGLSQSLSVDVSKYRDLVSETLFGPKGSNGGLFSAIHGPVNSLAGVLA